MVLKTDRQIGKKRHGRLEPKWNGPYIVTKVNKTSLQIKPLGARGKVANASVSLVKRYYASGITEETSTAQQKAHEGQPAEKA